MFVLTAAMFLVQRLSELRLCSRTLNTLSLVGCQSLVQVDLACANLQQLLLDGCQQLSLVSLAPVSRFG